MADGIDGREPCGHAPDTDECMEGHGRNFRAFWSNRLKKNQLSPDRFSDLDRIELVNRLDRLADVRRAVVARGKTLVANPQYPDTAIIRKMSLLLADKLCS
jgi:hypothetical protein